MFVLLNRWQNFKWTSIWEFQNYFSSLFDISTANWLMQTKQSFLFSISSEVSHDDAFRLLYCMWIKRNFYFDSLLSLCGSGSLITQLQKLLGKNVPKIIFVFFSLRFGFSVLLLTFLHGYFPLFSYTVGVLPFRTISIFLLFFLSLSLVRRRKNSSLFSETFCKTCKKRVGYFSGVRDNGYFLFRKFSLRIHSRKEKLLM